MPQINTNTVCELTNAARNKQHELSKMAMLSRGSVIPLERHPFTFWDLQTGLWANQLSCRCHVTNHSFITKACSIIEKHVVTAGAGCSGKPNLVSWKYAPLCTFCATPFYVPYSTFHRSFKEKCPLSGTKTQVKYVNPGTFLLRWYRYILLCFYYVATDTYCTGSEFKYLGSVPKSSCSIMPYTKPNPKPTR